MKTMIPSLKAIIFSILFLSSCTVLSGDNTPTELIRPWELNELFDANGNQIELFEGEVHIVRFNLEGEFTGSTECNELGGNYRAEGGGDLKVTELIATEQLCPDPNHSAEFLNGLAEVKRFKNEDGHLTIFYGEEGKLVFLERLE